MKEDISTEPAIPHLNEGNINFENNDTEITISRLRDPIVLQQLNQLLLQQEIDFLRTYKEDTWIPHLPEGWDGSEKYKLLINTKTGKIVDTEALEVFRSTEPTLESIAHETERSIKEAMEVTSVDFGSDSPDADKISLEWKMPWTDKEPNTKQWSIIEAHEKGHLIRSFRSSLDARFRRGFDISAVNFTKADHEVHKYDAKQATTKIIGARPDETTEEFGVSYLNEYLFTAMEIAERMSQLKNYFGFTGSEEFTKEHLAYAREHYLEDTDMDNSMRLFFEGITPKTEAAFLELINSSGI